MYHPQPCILTSPSTGNCPRWQLQRAKKNIKQLHTLQLVCSLWRATALRPTLWTLLLNLDLPHGQFKGVLKHTESAPLYIDYNHFDQPSDLNVRSSSANWTLALRNMTRIRSLRLCFEVPGQGMLDTKSLQSSFRQLSPQIVSFVITMPSVSGSTQIVRLPETFLDVPDSQLDHLSFFDCYLTPKKRLPDLTTLIVGYTNESMNSSEFIIPWLSFISKSGAPHLRSLMVHGNFVLQAANHQREAISLPITLSKLTLWCSIRTLRSTLSHIIIPPRCTIMIGITGPWFRDTPTTSLFPRVFVMGEGGHMLLKQVGKMREVVARPGTFSREDLESMNLANNGKGIYPIVDQHTWLCLYLRSYEPDDPRARRPEGEPFLPAMRKYISGFSTVQNIHIHTFEIVNWGLELRVIEPDEFKAELHRDAFLGLRQLRVSTPKEDNEDIHQWIIALVWNRFQLHSCGFPVSRIEYVEFINMHPEIARQVIRTRSTFTEGHLSGESGEKAWESYYRSEIIGANEVANGDQQLSSL
ncbi:hypothetical protein NMY22_g11141 [Coprinellus aureogranulatus]|nr:hypothetical protein NMY22_g11141 [Coprinellus aureogranulatus]